MAIVIPHRFTIRLLPDENIKSIRYLLIGTFNPGKPLEELLTPAERMLVDELLANKKYLRFEQVRNFYDRPSNRLWGLFDRLNNPQLYAKNGFTYRNYSGLKYYKGLDRDTVFLRQQSFCLKQGIFLSDLVTQIVPVEVTKIYNQFKDTDVDSCVTGWNTTGLLNLIKEYNPEKIIFNFKPANAIPKLSEQMDTITRKYPNKAINLLSPSGAAAKKYDALVNDWKQHLNILM